MDIRFLDGLNVLVHKLCVYVGISESINGMKDVYAKESVCLCVWESDLRVNSP